MTKEQALSVAYQAARLAPLNAESHEQVRQAFTILQEAIKQDDASTPGKAPKKA